MKIVQNSSSLRHPEWWCIWSVCFWSVQNHKSCLVRHTWEVLLWISDLQRIICLTSYYCCFNNEWRCPVKDANALSLCTVVHITSVFCMPQNSTGCTVQNKIYIFSGVHLFEIYWHCWIVCSNLMLDPDAKETASAVTYSATKFIKSAFVKEDAIFKCWVYGT